MATFAKQIGPWMDPGNCMERADYHEAGVNGRVLSSSAQAGARANRRARAHRGVRRRRLLLGGLLVAAAGCDSVSDFLSSDPITYTVGGELVGLADGETVVLRNRDEHLTLSQNGTFTFATRYETDTPFEVVVTEQPVTQLCSVHGGTGTVRSDDVRDVRVECHAVLNVSWAASRHSAVGRPGGGYTLYFSRSAGFHPDDAGVSTLDVPHDTERGETPTRAQVPALESGTWYFRVLAYSPHGRSQLSTETSFELAEAAP
jgi:hypothetical protein